MTQNIDNLHQAAGSKNVLEVHGSAFRVRCSRCGSSEPVPRQRIDSVLEHLSGPPPGRRRLLAILKEYAGKCDECGGRRLPDVVLFGQQLPVGVFSEAMERAQSCDCLLAVGTSAVVYPAASIPLAAARTGARLIEVNPESGPISAGAEVVIPMAAGEALPLLADETERLVRADCG